MAAAVPLDKAAELDDKVEDVSLLIIDASSKRPTRSGVRDPRRLLYG